MDIQTNVNELFSNLIKQKEEVEFKCKEVDNEKLELLKKYNLFAENNIERIRKLLPKKGETVKYIGKNHPTTHWTQDENTWKYFYVKMLKIEKFKESDIHHFSNIDILPKLIGVPLNSNHKRLHREVFTIPITDVEILAKSPKIKKQKGWVYLITDDDTELIKVGMTMEHDPMKRINNGNTGNPHNIIVMVLYQCYNPRKVESQLHDLFKKKRIRGEWFKLNYDDISIIEKEIEPNLLLKIEGVNQKEQLKTIIEDKELILNHYNQSKHSIEVDYSELKDEYLKANLSIRLGDSIFEEGGDNYEVKEIELNDELDDLVGFPNINIRGNRIYKNGNIDKRLVYIYYNELQQIDKFNFSYENYLKRKLLIKQKYEELKRTFCIENSLVKIGDIVETIFEIKYKVTEVNFIDYLYNSNYCYFEYRGSKINASGIASTKVEIMHRIKNKITNSMF